MWEYGFIFAWDFLVYLFLGSFFRLKNVEKRVCVINLKNAMSPIKSIFINVKKDMSELGVWSAAKHTTQTSLGVYTVHGLKLYLGTPMPPAPSKLPTIW